MRSATRVRWTVLSLAIAALLASSCAKSPTEWAGAGAPAPAAPAPGAQAQGAPPPPPHRECQSDADCATGGICFAGGCEYGSYAVSDGHKSEKKEKKANPATKVKKATKATKATKEKKEIELVRYPSVTPPTVMRPGKTNAVLVSLASEQTGPTVVTGPGGELSPHGSFTFKVPEPFDLPDEEAWQVQVQLEMRDATVDQKVQTLLVRRSGPSDVVTFKVKPTWTPASPQERRDTPLVATFTRKGRLIGRAIRLVPVTADPDFTPPEKAWALEQGGGLGDPGDRPDLYVQAIAYPRLPAPPGAKAEEITDHFLFQAQLADKDPLLVGGGDEFEMRGLDAFLIQGYRKMANHAPRSGDADPTAGSLVASRDAVRQLGADLWKLYTPELVKDRIRALQRSKPEGADIRFQTNDPRFPFELLLVRRDGKGDCGPTDDCELLGVLHRVSRWHVKPPLPVSPGVRTREGTLAILAPVYPDPLDAVELERKAIKGVAGTRYLELGGTVEKFVASLEAQPLPAVLHYAGHGKAHPGPLAGLEDYSLRLQDGELDLASFEQHAAWLSGQDARGPLLFLNGCEVGKGSGAYGWVTGWGPAALEHGAAGFIGGLWELGDKGAATFAAEFYRLALEGNTVAEAVRLARAQYDKAGDPTFAAYVYYGHPDLLLAKPK